MASIKFLWLNRAKHPVWDGAFVKAWMKRAWTSPEMTKRNLRRWSLVRKGAQIHECAEIGKATVEGNKRNLSVGAYSFVGTAYLAMYDRITIGERVCINDGVRLLTGSHDVMDPLWRHIKQPVTIEDYAWIAMGAIILPGVTIGRGAVVGAGAVVTKSVPPGAIVAGNPARIISKGRTPQLQYNPCAFLAANNAWLKG